MIELNNLILNPATSIDPQGITTELPEAELLNMPTDIQDTDEPISLDASSFVILMAQVLATTQVVKDENTNNAMDVQQDVSEVTGEIVEQELKDQSTDKLPLQDTPEAVLNIDNNVAMTWINSESYTPPHLSSSETTTDTVDTTVNAQELLPEAIVKAMNLFSETKPSEIDISHAKVIKPEIAVQIDPNLNQNLKNSSPDRVKDDLVPTNILMNMTASNAMPNAVFTKIPVEIDTNTTLETDNPVSLVNSLVSNAGIDPQTSKTNTDVKTLSIPVDVNSPQWSDEFAERIVWMGQQTIKSALIKVHPEDLGPIEINIKIVKDAATLNISSHSTHVCNIVDQSMPKLREMMAEQGINLAEVHISADANSQQSSQQHNNFRESVANNTEDEVLLTPLNRKPNKGLIDYFA